MQSLSDIARGLSLASIPTWQQRNNHTGHVICIAQLIDGDGIIQPGLTVELEMKAPVFAERCYYLFSMFRLEHGKRKRLYQLEVQPQGKRTHNAVIPIYGPHEHLGDEEPIAVTDTTVTCDNWAAGWLYFCSQTGIVHATVNAP